MTEPDVKAQAKQGFQAGAKDNGKIKVVFQAEKKQETKTPVLLPVHLVPMGLTGGLAMSGAAPASSGGRYGGGGVKMGTDDRVILQSLCQPDHCTLMCASSASHAPASTSPASAVHRSGVTVYEGTSTQVR